MLPEPQALEPWQINFEKDLKRIVNELTQLVNIKPEIPPETASLVPKIAVITLEAYLEVKEPLQRELCQVIKDEKQTKKNWKDTLDMHQRPSRTTAEKWYAQLQTSLSLNELVLSAKRLLRELSDNISRANLQLKNAKKNLGDRTDVNVAAPIALEQWKIDWNNIAGFLEDLTNPESDVDYAYLEFRLQCKENQEKLWSEMVDKLDPEQKPIARQWYNGMKDALELEQLVCKANEILYNRPTNENNESQYHHSQKSVTFIVPEKYQPRKKASSCRKRKLPLSNINSRKMQPFQKGYDPHQNEQVKEHPLQAKTDTTLPIGFTKRVWPEKEEVARIIIKAPRDHGTRIILSHDVSLVDVMSKFEDSEATSPKARDASFVDVMSTIEDSKAQSPESKNTSFKETMSETRITEEPTPKPIPTFEAQSDDTSEMDGDTSKETFEKTNNVSTMNNIGLTPEPKIELTSVPSEPERESTEELKLKMEMIQQSHDKEFYPMLESNQLPIAPHLRKENVQPSSGEEFTQELTYSASHIDEILNPTQREAYAALNERNNPDQSVDQIPTETDVNRLELTNLPVKILETQPRNLGVVTERRLIPQVMYELKKESESLSSRPIPKGSIKPFGSQSRTYRHKKEYEEVDKNTGQVRSRPVQQSEEKSVKEDNWNFGEVRVSTINRRQKRKRRHKSVNRDDFEPTKVDEVKPTRISKRFAQQWQKDKPCSESTETFTRECTKESQTHKLGIVSTTNRSKMDDEMELSPSEKEFESKSDTHADGISSNSTNNPALIRSTQPSENPTQDELSPSKKNRSWEVMTVAYETRRIIESRPLEKTHPDANEIPWNCVQPIAWDPGGQVTKNEDWSPLRTKTENDTKNRRQHEDVQGPNVETYAATDKAIMTTRSPKPRGDSRWDVKTTFDVLAYLLLTFLLLLHTGVTPHGPRQPHNQNSNLAVLLSQKSNRIASDMFDMKLQINWSDSQFSKKPQERGHHGHVLNSSPERAKNHRKPATFYCLTGKAQLLSGENTDDLTNRRATPKVVLSKVSKRPRKIMRRYSAERRRYRLRIKTQFNREGSDEPTTYTRTSTDVADQAGWYNIWKQLETLINSKILIGLLVILLVKFLCKCTNPIRPNALARKWTRIWKICPCATKMPKSKGVISNPNQPSHDATYMSFTTSVLVFMNITSDQPNPTLPPRAEEDNQTSSETVKGGSRLMISHNSKAVKPRKQIIRQPKRSDPWYIPRPCLFCGQKEHLLMRCHLSPKERTTVIYKSGRCIKCLLEGHKAADCSKEPCRKCKQPHHTFLCYKSSQAKRPRIHNPIPLRDVDVEGIHKLEEVTEPENEATEESLNRLSEWSDEEPISHMRSDPPIFLPTNRVQIANREATALCVYDTGSCKTFIKREFVESINAPNLGEETVYVRRLGEKSSLPLKTSKYLVRLLRADGEVEEIEAYATDQISTKCPSVTSSDAKWSPSVETQGVMEGIDILFGVIHFLRIFQSREEITPETFVIHTTLGDALCGRWEVDSWTCQNVRTKPPRNRSTMALMTGHQQKIGNSESNEKCADRQLDPRDHSELKVEAEKVREESRRNLKAESREKQHIPTSRVQNPDGRGETEAITQTASTSQNTPQQRTSHFKLPKIELPEFDGTITEFQMFWEIFKYLVDQKTETGVKKFEYLKSKLKGEPARLLADLPITVESYDTAKELLQKNYGDREALRRQIRLELFAQDSCESREEVRRMFFKTDALIRQLDAKAREENEAKDILEFLEQTLPLNHQRRLNRRRQNHAKWGFIEFRDEMSEIIKEDEQIARITKFGAMRSMGGHQSSQRRTCTDKRKNEKNENRQANQQIKYEKCENQEEKTTNQNPEPTL